MAGMQRHDLEDIQRINESKASVGSRAATKLKHTWRPMRVALMSYLVPLRSMTLRSKSLWNAEMQRMHKVMHMKPCLRRTSSRTQSQKIVYRMRMGMIALQLNQMKRLWMRHSIRVR